MKLLNMGLPNLLTLSRAVFALLVMLLLVLSQNISFFIYIAALLFLIGALTDFFDGYFARKNNIISTFGEIFDPLADKLLMLGAFIGLLYIQKIDPLASFLIISREFFITGIRVYAASSGENVAASIWGKIKTVMQIIALLAIMLNIPYSEPFLWLTVVVTLFSGWEYSKNYLKNLDRGLKE